VVASEPSTRALVVASPLFSGLDEPTLDAWTHRLRTQELGPGETVYREGDAGRTMYIVIEGSVEMVKASARGAHTRMAEIAAGQWFGEMSLLDVLPRAVTVRTLSRVRLVLVQPTDLEALYRANVKTYALLVMNIARQLSRRLRRAEAALADTAEAGVDLYGEKT
jgi:CRP-like cAMP-binding protein